MIHYVELTSNTDMVRIGETDETALDFVANNTGFFLEWNDESHYPNLCNTEAFTVFVNGVQTASIIGGVHSPQRPK